MLRDLSDVVIGVLGSSRLSGSDPLVTSLLLAPKRIDAQLFYKFSNKHLLCANTIVSASAQKKPVVLAAKKSGFLPHCYGALRRLSRATPT
jgi:hypothetical protein